MHILQFPVLCFFLRFLCVQMYVFLHLYVFLFLFLHFLSFCLFICVCPNAVCLLLSYFVLLYYYYLYVPFIFDDRERKDVYLDGGSGGVELRGVRRGEVIIRM